MKMIYNKDAVQEIKDTILVLKIVGGFFAFITIVAIIALFL